MMQESYFVKSQLYVNQGKSNNKNNKYILFPICCLMLNHYIFLRGTTIFTNFTACHLFDFFIQLLIGK